MARVLPSEAADAISRAYPWAKDWVAGIRAGGVPGGLGPEHAPTISMIVRLLAAIPSELMPIDAGDRVILECAQGLMAGALVSWTGAPQSGLAAKLYESPSTGNESPVVAALRVLQRCPDSIVSEDRPRFGYIKEADARRDLRADIGAALRAYSVADYKAATVMAGSVLEAVLLYRVSQLDENVRSNAIATASAKRQGASPRIPKSVDQWQLEDLVDVAAEAGELDSDSHKVAHATRRFRNLIHPGRALRTGERCSQGEAMSAVGAMLRIVERFD